MPSTTTTPAAARLTNGTIFAHMDFLLTGIVMTFLGPMLPILSARWVLNDTQAGNLFLAQYVSSTVGMLSSGSLVRRYGYRITLILGAVLMALGVAILAGADRLSGIAAICILGVGFGMTTPATNLFVSDAQPEKRASALNLLNSTWGVGAMSSPLIVAAAQRLQRTTQFFYLLAAGLSLLVAALGLVRFMTDESRHAKPAETHVEAPWNWEFVLLVSTIFFIYVGTETAVGGWMASYAHRIAPGTTAWTMTPSFFYGTLLLGRFLAPVALRSIRPVTVASAGAGFALIGILVLLSGHSIAMVIAGASFAGLGLSAIYPIKVSFLPSWFGNRVTRIGGFLFASGNFGGGALPWLVGILSTRFSSLRIGFVVPLIGAASLLAFYSSQRRSLTNQGSA